MFTSRLACVIGLVLVVLPASGQPGDEEPRPNFIVIFCDDLGYGDIGCFGSTHHRTPHIDSLAAEGMRLVSHYSTSGVCTPSRASLLTGCYPRRVNMHKDAANGWVLFPSARKGLNPSEITIAELMRTRGYATACIGKWHLGDQPPFLPTRQGFDEYFGIPYSNDMGGKKGGKRPPLPLMRGEKVIEAPAEQTTLTKRYTEEAIRFITANKEQPFFLYLPHTFPHVPLFASDEFRDKSANGRFGDTVEEIDASTGRILATLKELEIEQRTCVIFTSDNGAAKRWGGSNGPLRGYKGSTWEGGMRVPCVVRWPGTVPAGTTTSEMTTMMDWLPTLASRAGAALPPGRVIDGRDIFPILSGAPGAESPHPAFFYYYKDQLQAVRSDKFKLHLARKQGDKEIEAQLYDLEADIAESRNVLDWKPAAVQHLMALAEAARADLGDRGRRGANQRPAGLMEDPAPLVKSP